MTDELWKKANHLASFVMLLEHDQDYCIEKYYSDSNYWARWVDEVVDKNFKLVDPCLHFHEANYKYQEFLDFLDGNGFVVTREPVIRIERNYKNENDNT